MKKILFTFGLLMASVTTIVAEPLYLTFRDADGAERSFATTSLSMTVSDGQLVVSNDETQAQLTLSSLVSMRFTKEEAAGIDDTAAADDAVTVFSMKGEKLGEYKSAAEAEEALAAGTYIFKSANGSVKKIIK